VNDGLLLLLLDECLRACVLVGWAWCVVVLLDWRAGIRPCKPCGWKMGGGGFVIHEFGSMEYNAMPRWVWAFCSHNTLTRTIRERSGSPACPEVRLETRP